jgi:hypothetical protein
VRRTDTDNLAARRHCSKKCRSETDVRDAGPTGLRQPPTLAIVLEADWSVPEQRELVA